MPASPAAAGPWSDVAPADDEPEGLSGMVLWQKALLVAVPVLVVAISALIAWWLWPGDSTKTPRVVGKLSSGASPSGAARQGTVSPNVPQPSPLPPASSPPPLANPAPAVLPVLCYTPDQLRQTFAGASAGSEEILSDVVLTLCLCYARAIQYTVDAAPADDWLQPILDSPDKVDLLLENIQMGS
jgi:hypothetical protein